MIWFDNLNRADARKLVSWWNAHTLPQYFVRPSCVYRNRYAVYKQSKIHTMRITVYQWTTTTGRTKYSWFLDDAVDLDTAVHLAGTILNSGEDIADVTLDVDGKIEHSVTKIYESFPTS